MIDDEAAATTMAEVVGQAGLRRYLWLYFLIVPLAATTASVVAVSIAALQGLSNHDLALRLYALIVILSGKTLFCIAAAYLLALAAASFSAWFFARRLEQLASYIEEARFPPAQDEKHRSLIEDQKQMMRRKVNDRVRQFSVRKTSTLVFAVLYGVFALIMGLYWLAFEDYRTAINLLNEIAFPPALSSAEALPTPDIADDVGFH